MIVYFSSVTEYTARFVEKLGMPSVRIPLMTREAKEFTVDEDFVLIVPTYGSDTQGYLPRQAKVFLNNPHNRDRMVGVIGAGNRNFYDEFAYSADVIHNKTGVPLLYRVELSGSEDDVKNVKEGLTTFWQQLKQSPQRAPKSSTHS